MLIMEFRQLCVPGGVAQHVRVGGDLYHIHAFDALTPVEETLHAHYSLVGREYEWELMPLALNQGIGTLVWSPLGWARLTGKIGRGRPRPAASRLGSRLAAEAGPPVDA